MASDSKKVEPKKTASTAASGSKPPAGADADDYDDGDDDDGGEGDDSSILLGVVEPTKNAAFFQRRFFPSKVGGKPAWLNPRDIPSADSLTCERCKEPLRFVLQVYAAAGENKDTSASWHRMLYLFACAHGACLRAATAAAAPSAPATASTAGTSADTAATTAAAAGAAAARRPNINSSIRCVRSQLPRRNPFYAYEALKKDPKLPLTEDKPFPNVNLCKVCGLRGTKVCGACRSVHYCSAVHQKWDWTDAHKAECPALAVARDNAAAAAAAAAAATAANGTTTDTASAEAAAVAAAAGVTPKPAPPPLKPDEIVRHLRARWARVFEERTIGTVDEPAADDGAEEDSVKAKQTAHANKLFEQYKKDEAEAAKTDEKGRDDSGDGDDDDADGDGTAAATDANVDAVGPYGIPLKKDAVFIAFERRIKRYQSQILRFDLDGGAPLWVSTRNQLATRDVPRCTHCGGEREFEFQILPQLLYYLGVDSDGSAEAAAALAAATGIGLGVSSQTAAAAAAAATATGNAATALTPSATAAAPTANGDAKTIATPATAAPAAATGSAASTALATAADSKSAPATVATAPAAGAITDDPMDWGTVVVYTCLDSCGDGQKQYFDEFVYLQPIE